MIRHIGFTVYDFLFSVVTIQKRKFAGIIDTGCTALIIPDKFHNLSINNQNTSLISSIDGFPKETKIYDPIRVIVGEFDAGIFYSFSYIKSSAKGGHQFKIFGCENLIDTNNLSSTAIIIPGSIFNNHLVLIDGHTKQAYVIDNLHTFEIIHSQKLNSIGHNNGGLIYTDAKVNNVSLHAMIDTGCVGTGITMNKSTYQWINLNKKLTKTTIITASGTVESLTAKDVTVEIMGLKIKTDINILENSSTGLRDCDFNIGSSLFQNQKIVIDYLNYRILRLR